MQNNKFKVIFSVAVVIVIVAVGAFYFGRSNGVKTAQPEVQKFQQIAEKVFPKPPEVINRFSGIVKAVTGATIDLEITDPNDYMPHTDGTPQAKQVRYVTVIGSTTFTSINMKKLTNGIPEKATIALADIKVGDGIEVKSGENIHNVQKFNASDILLIKY